MKKEHTYLATVTWTGNRGTGTSDYKAYDRGHTIFVAGKPDIAGTSVNFPIHHQPTILVK